MLRRLSCVVAVLLTLVHIPLAQAGEKRHTENVIVITLDGFRWQEFFGGADESLVMDKKTSGIKDLNGLLKRHWDDSKEQRRDKLLPFIWGTIAKEGQIFGDAAKQAPTKITNGLKFSYPGYSEIFCGFADPAIDSNAKKDNANLSVLEFLHGRPGFEGRVAAFCSWDVFPYIFRARKNGLKVQAAFNPINDPPLSERQVRVNESLEYLPRIWPDCAFDHTTMDAAREHIRRHKPRVLYISLGETDEWGHGRRYDLYLDAARNADRFIAELWKSLQETPQYKDRTTLILTTDHGRGPTRADWTDHGKNVPTAEFIWIAVLGPDTPGRGVRENVTTTQSQVAATIAAFLGEDFRAASPKAAEPLPGVIR